MRIILSGILLSLLPGAACKAPAQSPRWQDTDTATGSGFAVVELFTSEGCSSCPPADQVLATLSEQYRGKPVLLLEEHVDYWDRLGWKDPFSQKLFSDRQYAYVQQMGLPGAYTPQAVVNGGAEAGGYNGAALRQLIGTALAVKHPDGILLNIAPNHSGNVTVSYQSAAAAGRQKMYVMLVQRSTTTNVARGENGGKKLPHINVVREMKTTSPGKGSVVFSIPGGLAVTDYFIAAFIQEPGGPVIAMAMTEQGI